MIRLEKTQDYTTEKKANFNISHALFIMAANRLICSRSKPCVSRRYKDKVYIPQVEVKKYFKLDFTFEVLKSYRKLLE